MNKSTKFLPATPPISKSGFFLGAALALAAGLFKIFFLTDDKPSAEGTVQ